LPYIKSGNGRREALQRGEPALTAGELNYQIFYYVKHYKYRTLSELNSLVEQFLGNKPNYQKYNDMTGALLRCEREIYRRLNINATFLIDMMNSYDNEIAKYEDTKIIENGDVE
jgi:hypothetical protein